MATNAPKDNLLPIGASPEDQAAQSEAWTAAVAYAALLHDIGKIAVDLHVELADGSTWHPWHGRCTRRTATVTTANTACTASQQACSIANCSTATSWTGSATIRLSGAPLLYVQAGQYEHAGVLGELVVQADRTSVAQELGGDPARAMAAPKHALLDGLHYLLKEQLKLNQPEASDGWLTEDGLWLVSKTVSDKLRAHLLSQGIDGIPANNTAVYNVLQDHGMLQPTSDGKAVWRATVTSTTGWSHSFTLLRLAPALIWESGERPAPFAGTVEIDATPAENDASMSAPAPTVSVNPAQGGQEPPIWEGDSTTIVSPPAAQPVPDVMEDLLAMVGLGESAGVGQDAEEFLHSPAPATAATSIPSPAPAPAPTPGSSATKPSGEQFMVWLKQGIASRRLIINDAKALVHTVNDTAYLVSPGVFQRYAQEHPEVAALAKQENQQDWQWVQKRFEKLQLHRSSPMV